MAHITQTIPSPVGPLRLVAGDRGLMAVLWRDDRPGRVRLGELVEDPSHVMLRRAATQLGEYFAGRRTAFDIPLDMTGTALQLNVWAALSTIPFGETRSYGAIAVQIGSPKACRAVGAANGRNPLSIVVPCHRVIGSNAKLTGFAGGLETKRYLLDLESRQGRLAA